jgi:DNA-nicking Smr family endonuclease
MAKRAKATKTAGARPKAEQTEPFFRPFSKLNTARTRQIADKKAADRTAAEKKEQPAARRSTPRPSTPGPDGGHPQTPAGDAAPPPPTDPHTFAVYMAGVRALPGDRAHRIPAGASKIERAGKEGERTSTDDGDADAHARMRSLISEGLRFETMDDGERLEGRRLDVDPRELRRLRRGQYSIDGRIDLHGLGADEARHAVELFVKKRSHEGDRVVLVVHGKGSHSPRGHAVLRGEIAAWLSQGRSARHIAAFTTAPDEHGGTGAVLVLLAR